MKISIEYALQEFQRDAADAVAACDRLVLLRAQIDALVDEMRTASENIELTDGCYGSECAAIDAWADKVAALGKGPVPL